MSCVSSSTPTTVPSKARTGIDFDSSSSSQLRLDLEGPNKASVRQSRDVVLAALSISVQGEGRILLLLDVALGPLAHLAGRGAAPSPG